MKTNRKNKLKIIAACSVAIFSLATAMGGAYAWFTLMMKQESEIDPFVVVNTGTCDLFSVELIKFNYHTTSYGEGDDAFTVIDYLNPELGEVRMYDYNEEEGTFGYYDNETWVAVDMMNVFDPVDMVIYNETLRDLNCNALYKFTVSSNDFTDINLQAAVAKVVGKEKLPNELFLSTCVDFDIFFESDLDDDNPLFIDGLDTKLYYPSYIDKSESMGETEAIYHKLSYLSSLRATHPHFYGGSDNEISIGGSDLEFVYSETAHTKLLSFYVNVNYAPSQLESAMTKIYKENIKAVFDFTMKFYFMAPEDND